MFDCPPVPPTCTDTYSKVAGVFFPSAGSWPYLTLHFNVITGLPITEYPNPCDTVNGSAWACVTPQSDNNVPGWDWHLLASGLDWPVDGSNTWEWSFYHPVHLRDWNLNHPLYPFRAVTFRCVAVNLDYAGIGLTCPSEVAPAAGGCIPWVLLPEGLWPYDLNQSGYIEVRDVLEVLQHWGAPWDSDDLLLLFQHWGESSPWSIPVAPGDDLDQFPLEIRRVIDGEDTQIFLSSEASP